MLVEDRVKIRPILFSAPMVRALLDGSKTQTRRALKTQPIDVIPMKEDKCGVEWVGLMQREPEPKGIIFRCKFGQKGDRLWVREAWANHPDYPESTNRAIYRADRGVEHDVPRWRPSIHMPRWASRITLEITGVRVERLQDISEEDALAEGIVCENVIVSSYYANGHHEVSDDRYFFDGCDDEGFDSAHDAYASLWESINGAGSWEENPWVWVVAFRRVEA